MEVVTYTDDFDIIAVHERIIAKFSEKRGKMPKWKDKIDRLRMELESGLFKTVNEYNKVKDKIKKLQSKISVVELNSEYESYKVAAKDILVEYVKIRNNNKKYFGEEPVIDDETYERRHQLISDYLEIARLYISLNVVRLVSYDLSTCPICLIPFESENGFRTCLECGQLRPLVTPDSCQGGSRKIISVKKNSYDDRENFKKALARYKGKQPNKLPSDLISKLDDYFHSYGLSTSKDILHLPLVDGKRGSLDKDSLYRALSEKGYAGFYEDINLICHIYWGWDLPDISLIEDQIVYDYDESQKVYNEIKTKRRSCINTQYRLFRHLQHRGHPCSSQDFKMIRTRNILEDYENIWQEICRRLDWIFKPIL